MYITLPGQHQGSKPFDGSILSESLQHILCHSLSNVCSTNWDKTHRTSFPTFYWPLLVRYCELWSFIFVRSWLNWHPGRSSAALVWAWRFEVTIRLCFLESPKGYAPLLFGPPALKRAPYSKMTGTYWMLLLLLIILPSTPLRCNFPSSLCQFLTSKLSHSFFAQISYLTARFIFQVNGCQRKRRWTRCFRLLATVVVTRA